jgi:hypothetical protein
VGTSALAPPKRLLTRGRLRAWLPTAALGAAAFVAALSGEVAVTTALGAALVVATLIASGALRDRDVMHPAVIVAGFNGVLTLGRSLYVLDREIFGLRLDAQLPLAGNERAFALGVFAQMAGVALFTVGTARARRRQAAPSPRPTRFDLFPLYVGILVIALAAAVSIAFLVRESGGLGDYIDVLGFRQVLFDDRGFAVVFPTMLPGVVLAWFALNIGSLDTGNRRAIALTLLVLAVVAAAATGTRSLIAFFLFVPLLVLFRIRVRRIPFTVAVVIAVLVFAAGALYRTEVRERGNTAAGALYQDGAKGFVVNAFASSDAHQPDPVATLINRDARPKFGSTIAAAALTPIPRRVWDGKPTSANQQFTELESPEQFESTSTEFAITFAGELYWNFWWVGLTGFALVGVVAGAAYRNALARPGDPLSSLLYAAALAATLLLIRTDVYNTTVVALQVFLPALALLWIGRRMAERA